MSEIIRKIIFTEKETSIISKFILENEDRIKSLGKSNYGGASENSLTGTFRFHNFFNLKPITPILSKELMQYAPHLRNSIKF